MNQLNEFESRFEEIEKAFPEIDVLNVILIDLIINKALNREILKRFKSVNKWVKQCFNEPSEIEMAMCALNELIDGHGVETINIPEREWDSYWFDTYALYVNTGDTYSMTIIYDCEEQTFELMSWGDFYETLEIKKEINY